MAEVVDPHMVELGLLADTPPGVLKVGQMAAGLSIAQPRPCPLIPKGGRRQRVTDVQQAWAEVSWTMTKQHSLHL